MSLPFSYPKFKAVNSLGLPYSGGKVYTYAGGTSTAKATYSDYGLTVLNANPVILDSNGEATIFLSPGEYKVILKDSADALIWTMDYLANPTETSVNSLLTLTPVSEAAGGTGQLRFRELAANGTSYVAFRAPDALSGNVLWTLPSTDGTAGQSLVTSGSSVLSWASFASGMSNPMTANGDTLYKSVSANPDVLPIGLVGQVLSVTNVGGNLVPRWGAASATSASGANGDVQINSGGSFGVDTAVFLYDTTNHKLSILGDVAAGKISLATRNTNAGTGAFNQILLGNDLDPAQFIVQVNSSTYTLASSCAYVWHKGSGDLIFATNNAEVFRLVSGYLRITGATASRPLFTDASKNVVTTGTVPLNQGGTGAITAADARTNLSLGTMATQSAAAVAITGGSITGITDLAVADGGTGASTAAAARTNLSLGWIDARAYGATTGSSDNSAAIQAAVDANVGKAILLPEVYQIATTITITPSTANRIIGLGRTTSGLYSTANIALITFNAYAGDIYYSEVSGLYLASGNTGTRTSSFGIEVVGAAYGLRRSSFHDLHSRGNYCGVYIHTGGVSDWLTFDRILFDNYGANVHFYGIRRTTGNGQATYSNLTIFSDGTNSAGIYFDGGSFGDFTIMGLNHDGGTYGIVLDGTGQSYHSHFSISGANKFDNVSVPVSLTNCDWFRVIGNAYLGADADPIHLGTCSNYTIDAYNAAGFTASYT